MTDNSAHAISIVLQPGRVRVRFGGEVVADTMRALAFNEGVISTVLYVPREDAAMAYFSRTKHSSYCPFKGDASYYSLIVGERVGENAVWSYEQPLDGVADIKGHLAFYADRVDAIETDEA